MTTVRFAAEADVPLILDFIRALAAYERLGDDVVASEAGLRRTLFGPRAYAEVLLAEQAGASVGFALFFHNYSTFLGKPGIYLEDLFVRPPYRGAGVGRVLLKRLAEIALERDCGRLEWWVLDWNAQAIGFYQALGAQAMDDWTVYRLSGKALEDLARV
ncbi:MAG: GNAT family N-acetyltransferase [Pseudomonadota bacterium]